MVVWVGRCPECNAQQALFVVGEEYLRPQAWYRGRSNNSVVVGNAEVALRAMLKRGLVVEPDFREPREITLDPECGHAQ